MDQKSLAADRTKTSIYGSIASTSSHRLTDGPIYRKDKLYLASSEGMRKPRTTRYRSTHAPTISSLMMFWLIGCVDVSCQRDELSYTNKPNTTVASNQGSL